MCFMCSLKQLADRPSLLGLRRMETTLLLLVLLPSRTGGDGGADVILGREPDTVFATDRTAGGGKIYYYLWESGAFHQKAVHDTGSNPRYTVALPGGDIVSCNQDGGTLTV